MILAKNIRYLRLQKGLSQDQLAEMLGYKSYTTIQKWESGVSEPPLKTLSKLADIFKVDMDELVSRDFEEPQEEHHHYLNPETEEMAQEIADNPDLHMLFSALRDSQPDDLKLVTDMVKRFKGID